MNIKEILEGIKNWITGQYALISSIPVEKGSGTRSVQQKNMTSATGDYSFAEGNNTQAIGASSHAEGTGTIASGAGAHAEGVEYNEIGTSARADAAHAEGAGVVVKGQAAHGEGLLNVVGRTQEEAVAALADFPNLSGTTEQKVSKLIGFAAHSEGSSTQALGTSSHTEGNSTKALVNATHAEGDSTTASGEAAHSEGNHTTASGNQAHAEGYNTEASANQAHAEGKQTKATSENAHAEGNHTTAKGNASHTEGYYTVANNNVEHAEGQYNVSNKASTTFGNAGNTIHSVGIGGTSLNRNAFEIMQNGDAYLIGVGGYDGTNPSGSHNLKQVVDGKYEKPSSGIPSTDLASNAIKTFAGKSLIGSGDIVKRIDIEDKYLLFRYTGFDLDYPEPFSALLLTRDGFAKISYSIFGIVIEDFGNIIASSYASSAAKSIVVNIDSSYVDILFITGYDSTLSIDAYSDDPPVSSIMPVSIHKYYQKPSTGIPASDLATGVIPDVSQFITQTVVEGVLSNGDFVPDVPSGSTAQDVKVEAWSLFTAGRPVLLKIDDGNGDYSYANVVFANAGSDMTYIYGNQIKTW